MAAASCRSWVVVAVVAVLCLSGLVTFVQGQYPSDITCKNRALTIDCFGRPQTHLKSPYFNPGVIETVPVASWGVGTKLCVAPENCTKDACQSPAESDALTAVDGLYDTAPNSVDNIRIWFPRGPFDFVLIKIYWASDATAQTYTLTGGTVINTPTYTHTINGAEVKPGNVTEISISATSFYWFKVQSASAPCKVAEMELYGTVASVQEPCPGSTTPNQILGPAVVVVFNQENLVEGFQEIRWDQITHIIFEGLKPNGATYVPLSPCTISYLQSLVCWAHAKSVEVYIRVDGESSDFAATVADTNTINSFVSAVKDFVNTYNLDGIDLNWHYPSSDEEGSQYEALLGALYGDGSVIISAGLPLDSQQFGTAPSRYFPYSSFPYAHWYHLNGWGYLSVPPRDNAPTNNGEYTDANGQNPAPYDRVVDAISYWNLRGIPYERMVLGVPFFGVSFSVYTGGEQSYRSIMARYPGFSPSNEDIGYIKYTSWQGIHDRVEYAMNLGIVGILGDEYNQDELRGTWEHLYPELDKYGRLSLLDSINDALPFCGAEVEITYTEGSGWTPSTLTINQNDKVRWNWQNKDTHNVAESADGSPTYLKGGFYSGTPLDGSNFNGNFERADKFTKVFNVAGTYYYFDEVTSSSGTITVNSGYTNSTCVPLLPRFNFSSPIGDEKIDPDSSSASQLVSILISLLVEAVREVSYFFW